jgi:hypothetical protein
MALGTIFSLDRSIAVRSIHVLYWLALILITLGVIFGILGGIRIMTHPPRPLAESGAFQSPAAQPDQMGAGPQQRLQRDATPNEGRRLGLRRWHHHHPGLFAHLPRQTRGVARIVFALLRGLIALLIVRVLAEIGLTILTGAYR